MSDSAILVVSDQTHIPHAKALMVNCRREGKWMGDFALMCPSNTDTSSVEGRGIDVFFTAEPKWSYRVKYHIWNLSLQKWRRVLYMDCDCIVQGDLNAACDKESHRFPKVLTESQLSTVLEDWKHFDPEPDKHLDLYERLKQKYPNVEKQVRCGSVMLFDPSSIPAGTVQKMFEIQDEFKVLNPSGADQQVMDLALYDQLEPIGKDFCCWWAFDDPGNRVASAERGWRGDENPAIVHYWSSFAPWLEKTPDAGAYFNHRLGRPCFDIYQDNLASFDSVFPRNK